MGADISQFVVVIQQVLILLLAPHLGYDVHISVLGHIVKKKDGSFNKEGKRLAVDVVEFPEQSEVWLFENGARYDRVCTLTPHNEIQILVEMLLGVWVEENFEFLVAFANIVRMENDHPFAPVLLFESGNIGFHISELGMGHQHPAKGEYWEVLIE